MKRVLNKAQRSHTNACTVTCEMDAQAKYLYIQHTLKSQPFFSFARDRHIQAYKTHHFRKIANRICTNKYVAYSYTPGVCMLNARIFCKYKRAAVEKKTLTLLRRSRKNIDKKYGAFEKSGQKKPHSTALTLLMNT